MIEMREQEKKKLYFKHAIAYTKKKLLQICEFPSLPKPKKKITNIRMFVNKKSSKTLRQ